MMSVTQLFFEVYVIVKMACQISEDRYCGSHGRRRAHRSSNPYLREEVVAIAKDCGLKLSSHGRTKTMSTLCGQLRSCSRGHACPVRPARLWAQPSSSRVGSDFSSMPWGPAAPLVSASTMTPDMTLQDAPQTVKVEVAKNAVNGGTHPIVAGQIGAAVEAVLNRPEVITAPPAVVGAMVKQEAAQAGAQPDVARQAAQTVVKALLDGENVPFVPRPRKSRRKPGRVSFDPTTKTSVGRMSGAVPLLTGDRRRLVKEMEADIPRWHELYDPSLLRSSGNRTEAEDQEFEDFVRAFNSKRSTHLTHGYIKRDVDLNRKTHEVLPHIRSGMESWDSTKYTH